MSDVILPVSWRHSRIDVGVFAHDLMWRLRPHSRRSPGTSRDAHARCRGPHLRPSLALVCGRQDRVWPMLLEPPAQSFFKSGLRFWLGFGMTGTRHELAPPMTIQQAIDARDVHRMLHLRFKGSLNFFRCGNFSVCGSREKGLEKAAFLLHAHVFMTASPFAWRFYRGKSQAVIGGNDATHRRD